MLIPHLGPKTGVIPSKNPLSPLPTNCHWYCRGVLLNTAGTPSPPHCSATAGPIKFMPMRNIPLCRSSCCVCPAVRHSFTFRRPFYVTWNLTFGRFCEKKSIRGNQKTIVTFKSLQFLSIKDISLKKFRKVKKVTESAIDIPECM